MKLFGRRNGEGIRSHHFLPPSIILVQQTSQEAACAPFNYECTQMIHYRISPVLQLSMRSTFGPPT